MNWRPTAPAEQRTHLSLEVEQALYDDFAFFAAKLWMHLNLPGLTLIQTDIADFLQRGPRRRMVEAFRGVGKSWLTAAYVLWRLFRDPNERILVISASKDRADGFTVFVRQLIADVDWLQFLKPRKGRRDSVVAFDVGPSEAHQSPSVKSAGITGQITGSRASLIVADDIEVPANSLTHLLRERLAEQVKEFDAILMPGGDVVYLGTPQTEMSLYKQLPERGYDVRIWPARTPTRRKLSSYGDMLAPIVHNLLEREGEWKPTDPERFAEEDLAEREASYGRSGFALQFQLDQSLSDLERFPLKASDLIITEVSDRGYAELHWGRSTAGGAKTVLNDLPCAGLTTDRFYRPMHAVMGTFNGTGPAPEFTGSVMFVDPSGGGTDETAWAVLKMCMGRLYLTASGGRVDGFSDRTLAEIAKVAKAQSVNTVLVEPNYGGGMFTEMLKAAFTAAGYPCTIEDAEWSRGQKELRIIDVLEPLMNQHRLVVDRAVVEADLKAAQDYDIGINEKPQYQLIYQMTRLTREKDCLRHEDRLEAVAGAAYYYIAQAGASAEQAKRHHEEQLLDEELEKFVRQYDEMHGGPPEAGQPGHAMRGESRGALETSPEDVQWGDLSVFEHRKRDMVTGYIKEN